MKEKLLEVKNLSVAFKYDGKFLPQTRDISFDIYKGEILGLVGESGSGKSVTSKVLLQLLPPTGSKILSGEAIFEGEDLVQYPRKKMYNIRGNKISMVFQEPMTSLNPVYTCGNQIEEAIMLHQKLSKKEARKKAIEMMEFVGIPLPESRIDNYPHEMSGGMRQRVMIAMALSCNPKLLIADEPTTALDVTVQAQITDLMKHFQKEFNMSIIYITHDMGVIAEMADTIAVMYLGRVVESGSARAIFKNPIHPYTKGLLKSMPVLGNKSSERLHAIEGNVPVPLDPPDECGFCSRCQEKTAACAGSIPPLVEVEPDHLVRCFHYQGE